MSIGSAIRRFVHALAVQTATKTADNPVQKSVYPGLVKSERSGLTLQAPSANLQRLSALPSQAVEPESINAEDVVISQLLNSVRTKRAVTVVHGRAGTGKTTLIKTLANKGLRHIIVAPTGIAALNAGGQTLHKFFGIPPRIINLDDIEPRQRLRSIVSRLDVIIIDEISMVRADLLDVVDRTLRVNLDRSKPFGGIPMVFVGDFLQLPPIVNETDAEILQSRSYELLHAFAAKCLDNVPLSWIELEKVHRQKDTDFIDLLGSVRTGNDIEKVVKTLNARCHRPHRASTKPILLTSKTITSEQHNQRGLAALPGEVHSFHGVIEGDFRVTKERLPAPEVLKLKLGARVLLVKNDPEIRWVNGSLGTVSRLSGNGLWIILDGNRKECEVKAVEWESFEYRYDPLTKRVNPDVVGTYTQFPIQPAWAMTVHKAQGLTLDDVRVDLGEGAFTCGQTYVALSRCTSLDGLSLDVEAQEVVPTEA